MHIFHISDSIFIIAANNNHDENDVNISPVRGNISFDSLNLHEMRNIRVRVHYFEGILVRQKIRHVTGRNTTNPLYRKQSERRKSYVVKNKRRPKAIITIQRPTTMQAAETCDEVNVQKLAHIFANRINENRLKQDSYRYKPSTVKRNIALFQRKDTAYHHNDGTKEIQEIGTSKSVRALADNFRKVSLIITKELYAPILIADIGNSDENNEASDITKSDEHEPNILKDESKNEHVDMDHGVPKIDLESKTTDTDLPETTCDAITGDVKPEAMRSEDEVMTEESEEANLDELVIQTLADFDSQIKEAENETGETERETKDITEIVNKDEEVCDAVVQYCATNDEDIQALEDKEFVEVNHCTDSIVEGIIGLTTTEYVTYNICESINETLDHALAKEVALKQVFSNRAGDVSILNENVYFESTFTYSDPLPPIYDVVDNGTLNGESNSINCIGSGERYMPDNVSIGDVKSIVDVFEGLVQWEITRGTWEAKCPIGGVPVLIHRQAMSETYSEIGDCLATLNSRKAIKPTSSDDSDFGSLRSFLSSDDAYSTSDNSTIEDQTCVQVITRHQGVILYTDSDMVTQGTNDYDNVVVQRTTEKTGDFFVRSNDCANMTKPIPAGRNLRNKDDDSMPHYAKVLSRNRTKLSLNRFKMPRAPTPHRIENETSPTREKVKRPKRARQNRSNYIKKLPAMNCFSSRSRTKYY